MADAVASQTNGAAASSSKASILDDESRFRALVFFATEGLGMERLAEGEETKTFGAKLARHLAMLQSRLGFYAPPGLSCCVTRVWKNMLPLSLSHHVSLSNLSQLCTCVTRGDGGF